MKVTEKNGTAEYKNGRIYINLNDGRKFRSEQVMKDLVETNSLAGLLFDLEYEESLEFSTYNFKQTA